MVLFIHHLFCHGTPAENLENMIVRFEVLTAVLLKMMWRVVG
jgi:hypothetical protein